MADDDQPPIAASLEHLTGSFRGQYSWITTDEAEAWYGRGVPFRITPAGRNVSGSECVALFRRNADGFEIEASGACPIWVNRQPVTTAPLKHRDMIEFGENGPLSRIRIYGERDGPEPTVSEILSDAGSYIRSSRRPFVSRVVRGATGVVRRVLFETTILFRAMVLLALALIIALLYWQWRTDQILSAQVDRRVAALATDIERTREEALRPADLVALQEDLRGSVDANRERLETLQAELDAAPEVIAAARESVVFLQTAYGLRHIETGRMLRHQMGFDGMPAMSPSGRPLFTLEGNGPIAEAQITGTGFLVAGTNRLITNRHVALPWEEDVDETPQEMEPVMLRFQAWFPGRDQPVPVDTLIASDRVDLAVLTMDGAPDGVRGLKIAEAQPEPGEAIIVMGYPTGMRSLLAQTGEAFVAGLQADGITGFWEVAERLAEADHIAPLSTRGIIGRVSTQTIVYDAETTHGGSGGPVLNTDGAVVAVNTAIIPEFGGSNLGVPATHIQALLASADETR